MTIKLAFDTWLFIITTRFIRGFFFFLQYLGGIINLCFTPKLIHTRRLQQTAAMASILENVGSTSSSSSSSQQWSWSSSASSTVHVDAQESEHVAHRKKLSMILRYIATMHHSNDASQGISFVRQATYQTTNVLRDNDVIFCTDDFRHVLAMDEEDGTLFKSPPFSFYRAAASAAASPTSITHRHYKRTLFSSRKTISSRQQQHQQQAATTKTTCWFRITRLAVESPPKTTPAVREYLRAWSESSRQANNVVVISKLLQQQQQQQKKMLHPFPLAFIPMKLNDFYVNTKNIKDVTA
jgi:hypothetical protein